MGVILQGPEIYEIFFSGARKVTLIVDDGTSIVAA